MSIKISHSEMTTETTATSSKTMKEAQAVTKKDEPIYNLADFTLRDMTEFGTALRKLGLGAKSMEEVANRIVRYIYEHLIDPETNEKACALVRFYKTHPYAALDAGLRTFASQLLDGQPESSDMKCLTLLATTGEKPEWNVRTESIGHQAIPLPSEKVVAQIPMISQLIKQFGLEINSVLEPDPVLLADLSQKSFNVFHIANAVGSSYIPAQEEFVIPYGVKSVLGFGGMLASGELFAVIMFLKTPVTSVTADMFKPLALSTKMALLSVSQEAVFS